MVYKINQKRLWVLYKKLIVLSKIFHFFFWRKSRKTLKTLVAKTFQCNLSKKNIVLKTNIIKTNSFKISIQHLIPIFILNSKRCTWDDGWGLFASRKIVTFKCVSNEEDVVTAFLFCRVVPGKRINDHSTAPGAWIFFKPGIDNGCHSSNLRMK